MSNEEQYNFPEKLLMLLEDLTREIKLLRKDVTAAIIIQSHLTTMTEEERRNVDTGNQIKWLKEVKKDLGS